jgi:hypothetical protein
MPVARGAKISVDSVIRADGAADEADRDIERHKIENFDQTYYESFQFGADALVILGRENGGILFQAAPPAR